MIWKKTTPSTTDIFRAASYLWDVSKSDLLSSKRNVRLVNQRWIIFALMLSRGFSHQEIADIFLIHKSTATYGLLKHLEQTDEEYLENSEALFELHDKIIHGYDPHPNSSSDSYRDYPNAMFGRQDCPNAGGFSDYDRETQTFTSLPN
jgi:hypothetical protein